MYFKIFRAFFEREHGGYGQFFALARAIFAVKTCRRGQVERKLNFERAAQFVAFRHCNRSVRAERRASKVALWLVADVRATHLAVICIVHHFFHYSAASFVRKVERAVAVYFRF